MGNDELSRSVPLADYQLLEIGNVADEESKEDEASSAAPIAATDIIPIRNDIEWVDFAGKLRGHYRCPVSYGPVAIGQPNTQRVLYLSRDQERQTLTAGFYLFTRKILHRIIVENDGTCPMTRQRIGSLNGRFPEQGSPLLSSALQNDAGNPVLPTKPQHPTEMEEAIFQVVSATMQDQEILRIVDNSNSDIVFNSRHPMFWPVLFSILSIGLSVVKLLLIAQPIMDANEHRYLTALEKFPNEDQISCDITLANRDTTMTVFIFTVMDMIVSLLQIIKQPESGCNSHYLILLLGCSTMQALICTFEYALLPGLGETKGEQCVMAFYCEDDYTENLDDAIQKCFRMLGGGHEFSALEYFLSYILSQAALVATKYYCSNSRPCDADMDDGSESNSDSDDDLNIADFLITEDTANDEILEPQSSGPKPR